MKKILLIAVFLLLPWVAFTQTWKSQADTLVLGQVAASLVGHADIFALPDVLTSHDSIFLSDGTYLHVPYSSCYAYFFDLMPFANWGHPCQYCFVNASLNHTVVQENAPPKDLNMVELTRCPRPNPNPHPVVADTMVVRTRRTTGTEHLTIPKTSFGLICQASIQYSPKFMVTKRALYGVIWITGVLL